MCPVCVATAALIAGSATSTGGLAAIVIRKFGMKKNRAAESVPNSYPRRDQDVIKHD
jgi:hypothetical protein